MKWWCLSIASILVSLLAACTARVAPSAPLPLSSPAPQPSQPAIATNTNAQQTAWEQVVNEAKKEGKLTLYTFNFGGDVGKAFVEKFQQRYGIRIEIVSGIATVLVERIKNEQKARHHTADLLDSALSLVNLAKQDGLIQPYGYLPVLEEKNVWNTHPKADPEGYMLGVRPSIITPYINTKLVKREEAPTSFKSLLSPRWAKQVLVDSPVTSVNSTWVYLAMRNAGILDDNYWREMAKQNFVIAPTFRDLYTKLIQGETQVALDPSDGPMAPYVKEGAPVQAVPLSEGVLLVPHSVVIGIVKDAPHPNAARVFLNWLSSQEGENTYSQAVSGIAVYRKDVPDIRSPAIRVDMSKTITIDLSVQLEATKIQRDGSFAKLLGVEK